MSTKIFVNWRKQQILTESGFNEMIAKRAKEKVDNDYELSYFLENEIAYSHSEVFKLTPEEKGKIYKEFQEYCRNEAEVDILNEDDWFEKFIEI